MPTLDNDAIRAILPHRYPFLLVDRIIEMDATHIVGIKNVTYNEPFFLGHFPDFPVMPGVMIIEAMAQTAGVQVLSTIPDRANKLVSWFPSTTHVFAGRCVRETSSASRCR